MNNKISYQNSSMRGTVFEKFTRENYKIGNREHIAHNISDDTYFDKIIVMKDYNWAKYSNSQLLQIAKNFSKQLDNCYSVINKKIIFFFSEKPPQLVIENLNTRKKINIDWVGKI